jgi:hypothetical protein
MLLELLKSALFLGTESALYITRGRCMINSVFNSSEIGIVIKDVVLAS